MKTLALHNRRRWAVNVLLAALLVFAVAAPAFAGGTGGTGTDPFSTVTQTVISWLKGGLGLLLAILSLGVGLTASIARGSLVGALTSIGIAIAAYWGPDILQSMFGASMVASHVFATVGGF